MAKINFGGTEENVVTREAQVLCSILEDRSKDGPVPVKDIFPPVLSVVIWNIVTGKAIR